jgi:CheY-like chemotaxis protein
METIKIPKGRDASTVLLADDEPEHLDWLVDYLRVKGCATVVATNVREAIAAVERQSFRAYLIDLNIPLGGWSPTIPLPSITYTDYNGLYILKLVRSQGNRGTHVIAYSAHQNDQIVSEIKRLYCRYIVKGRPRELKQQIDDLLSFQAPKPLLREAKKPKRPPPTRRGRKPA